MPQLFMDDADDDLSDDAGQPSNAKLEGAQATSAAEAQAAEAQATSAAQEDVRPRSAKSVLHLRPARAVCARCQNASSGPSWKPWDEDLSLQGRTRWNCWKPIEPHMGAAPTSPRCA